MYKHLLFLFVFAFSVSIYAQNVTVTGTITEASTGQPLPGVNLVLKNTSRGTSTDFDGNFTFNDVPLNSVLVVSYLGFKTQEITITNDQPLSIQLEDDNEALSEVVVIGYGTQRKELVTGAYSSLDSEKIVENIDDIFEGKAVFKEQDHNKATYAKKIDKVTNNYNFSI